MLKILVVASLTMPICALGFLESVDIGFRGLDKHIAIELTAWKGEAAVKFRLASNSSNKAVAISSCDYTVSSLEREVGQIQNPQVRADFRWIFFRSDYSATPIGQFFPEFKTLLERANPQCPVMDLERLTDQLDSQRG